VEFPYPETFNDDYSTRAAAASQEMSIARNMELVYDLKVDEPVDDAALLSEWECNGGEWAKEIERWHKYLNRLAPEQRAAWTKGYEERNKRFVAQKLKGEELLKWKYQEYLKDYLRCIKTVDDEVGRLINYLEEHDLLGNTIIVYTSDQGFYMGEHGWFDKRFMYEESFRTPLIIRYPGNNVPRGIENDALVQNIDYAPTYLDAAGAVKPEAMTGTSLLPLLSGNTPADWREYLYYHYYDYPAIHQVRRHDGVRDTRYKLVHFYGEGFGKDKGNDIDFNELFDLQNDPNELNNLYGQAAYQDIADRLQKRLDKFRTDLNTDEK
jgi:arylsulfatase A-like enzyme